jgi:2,3,4,5-tetrahydropyridine-2-carboxylate N-succinyltransferase
MKDRITELYENKPDVYSPLDRALLADFLEAMNQGSIRACEKRDGTWVVNQWIKKGILVCFRMGQLAAMPWSDGKVFWDKDTLPEKNFGFNDQVRIVPGGSSARSGCYIAKGVAIMPPAFINIGAYVDSGTLVDSHALVGSCAQIGKNVHLSAGAMIGGVLEPIRSRPVIVEDDVFIGGNCGIYEGVLISAKAVIASGTIITSSTPVFDCTLGSFLPREDATPVSIPSGAVVVPGSRQLPNHPGINISCPVIIKYRDAKTDYSVQLEQDIRSILD